jgi:ABC-2 type transport system ATP-binding protein
MHAVEAVALSRNYNGVRALREINLRVAEGEIFGLLGPNGAGKSTMIKVLTGQLRPTSGHATVMGYDVVTQRQQLKPLIGVVFDCQNVYERMSGRENLLFFGRLYGVETRRVDEVLAQVGIAERAGDKVKTYSNGMRQRLLIGRGLLHNPRVVFLDEPTRGLDPNIARDIRAVIAGLAANGITIFLATHYMEEADHLCQRVAILDEGRIVTLDTPARLKAMRGAEGIVTLEDVFVELTGRVLHRDS